MSYITRMSTNADGGGADGAASAVSGLAFLANAGPAITNRRLGPAKRVRARRILANAAPGQQQRGNRGSRADPRRFGPRLTPRIRVSDQVVDIGEDSAVR